MGASLPSLFWRRGLPARTETQIAGCQRTIQVADQVMAQELCGCCAQAAQQPQLQIDHHSYACSAQDFFQSTLLLRVTYIMSHPAFNYHDGLRCTEHWPRLCRKSKSHHEWNVHSLVKEYDRSHARLMGLMPRYEREAKSTGCSPVGLTEPA